MKADQPIEDCRIIFKYPNRRLYDTSTSQYITLEDIKTRVLHYDKFKIIDKKTEEDITCYILLQIVNQSEASTPVLTKEVLQNIIRFHNSANRSAMSVFLEQALLFFAQQQSSLQEKFSQSTPASLFGAFAKMAEKNLDLWRNMMTSQWQGQNNSHGQRQNPQKRRTKKTRI